MKLSLRQRLLAVALLGIFSCAVSLYALGRIISLNNQLRFERAREAVTTNLAALARGGAPLRTSLLGMRGGRVASAAFDAKELDCDEATRGEVVAAIGEASSARGAVLRERESRDQVLVVGARPTESGSLAWIAYSIRPSPFIPLWRFIVASLTLATLLLVAMAVGTVIAMRRSAASLSASLGALAMDLSAPVPRPPMRELGDIADRIAELAAKLARAQVEKERLGAELAQRERLAALGRVVTGVAHEVRNPLASIKLRVDLGRARAGTPPQLANELSFVSEEITRLDRLVADLLVVAGRRNGPRARAELGALVERRAALLRPWAEERGVRIETTGDATAEVDADAVARTIDNLVRNAVEASPAGASVRVELCVMPGEARLVVIDRGDGVDAARAHELFEPFFTTKPDGTGLGLWISRMLLEAKGATLGYDRVGDRTRMRITFPRG
jgi:signal transduction histidine kinase